MSHLPVLKPAGRPVLLGCAILGVNLLALAESANIDFSPQVERWGIEEITLREARSHANPFTEVNLKCRFMSAGNEVDAEGFYDGATTWKVRFMPPVEGQWRFETVSNDAELNGRKGFFLSIAPRTGNHGPVTVRNKYHFAYSDGTPYFPLGTTLYNWLHREKELQERTLATLKNSPFNKVRFCMFPKWYPFNHVEPPLYPYVKTGENQFDFDRFNPEYFRHIEARLLDLQALGIEADIILFHPYDRWGFASMDRIHDDLYLHYVIARLACFRNVWWTMANEWDFVRPGKDWDHIFQTVQKADPYHHLRAIHNGDVWYDHSKPWVTHCNIQSQTGDLYSTALGARLKYGKPILVDEYGYEGNNGYMWGTLSAAQAVRRHWEVTMAGGYATHGETYVHPGDVLWWAVGGELVGESPARLDFLKRIMTEAPYEEMEPLPDAVKGGTALGKRGQYYVFYFAQTDRGPAEIKITGDGPLKVDFIDPWLMKIYPVGYVRPGVYSFLPKLVPGLIRIVRCAQVERTVQPHASMNELLREWESGRLGASRAPAGRIGEAGR
jgi:hypothetical protein